MRVLHSSDLHGRHNKLFSIKDGWDIWIDTGDFFSNYGRNSYGYLDKYLEQAHQTTVFDSIHLNIIKWLNGRPMISVPGNHDFICLAEKLNISNAHAIRNYEQTVNLLGYTFAGFRYIPYIAGEWVGEKHNLFNDVQAVFDNNPDILLTHVPPATILSDQWGSDELYFALTKQQHKIQHHFFGHVHECGGMTAQKDGITFYNGATNVTIHNISKKI